MKRENQEYYRQLGLRITYFRLKGGWAQNQLAGRLGIKPSQLSRYEHGATGISLDMVIAIAQALGVSLMELFDFRDLSGSSQLAGWTEKR